ncbi:hypothetical protein CBR_g4629 [Chara braunii]|uniref:Reverse transcriptase domain-containing protein n=1 Tax=Chara braunii TaxID=69332 RepID=A0A388KIC0_CHABU|nr:hypothetical protein CBR_g4629 [Chara braunii]|eukprot:GBG69800.1 hypothetical protein CBR_g4629 [Chara braunii]
MHPGSVQCHVSSATSQCQISSATSAVPRHSATSAVPRHSARSAVPRQQCHFSSARSQCHVRLSATSAVMSDTVPRKQCHISSATSDTVPRQTKCHLAAIEAEEQRQLAVKAAQLQADEAATAEKLRLQAEANADAQARRKEAQALLQRHEASSIEKIKYWHFEPNGDEPTPEEQHKEFMAKLVSSIASSSRQLEERVDHVVAMLGDINTFAAPTTVSSQLHTLKTEFQQLQSTNADENPKMYKMPTFQLDKFDDYTQQDPVLWWEAFTTQLRILPVAKHAYIDALFLNSKGGCQTWLSHLATSHGVDVPDLKDKITWEELTRLWKKRFIVDDAPTLAINRSPYTYVDYAVHLVPPLDQPLHVQQSTACTVSTPSATDSAVSPPSITADSSSRSRLEVLDPLTFTDFQWMPVPPTRRLLKPHCNVLMAQLRDYLHTAVPTPLMDAGVEVVDLHVYIAKIDREFKTQRYDDIDTPLLYVHIQIGEATCSALIDCGASRNYISQNFMVRAGLGPRVRRKPQPTQVTLADGHTHKSIDRCIDSVPVYFAPHSSEAVSFDILDTKFDMILGMSWLRSKDHPVNFFNRTVHVRDRNRVLVPCTAPLPHPSISRHVVSAASMRASITRDDIQEMGVCFLHALPPHDASSTDSPSDLRVTELLNAYSDLFEGPHGVVPDRPIRHEIILEDGTVPPRGCIYRMSVEELSVLRAQLDDLLEKGWIRPSSSPYGAPVLFVRKKNKDLRMCIDYRKLNAQTIRNVGPLPRIDDLLERLGGAQFFSKMDLKSGYHQLKIRKEDRYKTAFKTRYGHFEWLVMPFGLTNAPTTFQAAMTTEFRHMLDPFGLIYLDDILVYSRSLDEHVEHLRTVLERLRQAKYKANSDKCEFTQQELEYLGHYVTPQGIRPLADKIEALRVWPEPTNTTDIRSFMGLAGYYQRFITGYSRIGAPMMRLQSPKVPFVFDDDARRSFQALKTAMLMAPVLSIYDPTLPTRVTTNASGYGIGAESGTTMKPSSTRHPQTDGQTERAHQTAQMMLRTLIRPNQKDWVDRLPDIEFAYNTSVHPAIGVTPFKLHHSGRKGQIFADLLLPRPADIDAACSPASVRKYRELLTQARTNMQKAQVRMQQQANRRRVPCPIRAGDLVAVSAEEFSLEQDVSRKLPPKWFGPWSVTAAAGDEPDGPSFVISIPEHLTVHPVFHASKLATYTPAKSDDFPHRRSQDPPSMDGH